MQTTWEPAPITDNEESRLGELADYQILDTSSDALEGMCRVSEAGADMTYAERSDMLPRIEAELERIREFVAARDPSLLSQEKQCAA